MARTIYVATSLVTVDDGEGNTKQVPDVGVTALTESLTETSPGTFMGSVYSQQYYGSVTLREVNTIQIGPTNYTLYSGQVENQQFFDDILAALGSARVKSGKDALTSPFRGRIESVVRSIRRKDDQTAIGFQAHTAIAGENPVLSSLDDTDVPDDFETVDPV